MRTLEPIPSAASAAAEKLVAIEKKSTVPSSAVNRIAVGSQPAALTTTTVRSAGGAPAARTASRAASGSRRSAVDADVAEAERRDALDRVRVDVHGDHGPALHRVARGGQRQLAGVPGAEHAHRAVARRQGAGLRGGRADVVDLERRRQRQVVGHRRPRRPVEHVCGARDLDLRGGGIEAR